MSMIVHYQVADGSKCWALHVWSDAGKWDLKGNVIGNYIDFQLPARIGDPRKLHFKLRSEDNNCTYWENDLFVRNIRLSCVETVWIFPASPRVMYEQPFPPGVAFATGDTLKFHVITRNRFSGGAIYVWNPYDNGQAPISFYETARNQSTSESIFEIPLQDWMTKGFHFKLKKEDSQGDLWESDSANKVWRPSDGKEMWIKSGQVNIRKRPLVLTPVFLEVLYPATMTSPPTLCRNDLGEDRKDQISATQDQPYAQSALFRVAGYSVEIYPDAPYTVCRPNDVCTANDAEESVCSNIHAFPPDPNDVTVPARFVLGQEGWIDSFPKVIPSARIIIEPRPSLSAFSGGIKLKASVDETQPYESVSATQQTDGSWQATLNVVVGARTYVNFVPENGSESKPYAWINTSRNFDAPSEQTDFFAVEGIFGLTTNNTKTQFGEPPSRRATMEAAFGPAIVAQGVFGANEMPHGATIVDDDVYFVVHAPHAVLAALVYISATGPSIPARRIVPMTLTLDLMYWWCKVSKKDTPPGTRYRFALNDREEVLDPAARAVQDGGSFETSPDDDPVDLTKSWSVVLDVADIYRRTHRRPWDTFGWESLLIYELHARRFTQLKAGSKFPLELLTDELQDISRMGKTGYLRQLPVTALQLMPVHEYEGCQSWGYNPAFYFAVDSSYGGATAMADFVDAAHAAGKAVILDVVYNHSNASPLMKIARDVYRNGDAWGDRMNCGHPMVLEFLRQATIYMWRTFNLCGFRFDDTKTIVSGTGGWEFLRALREALQRAASAEGYRYPYMVAENHLDGKAFDIPHPIWGVLHGEWAWDEIYCLRDVSYDTKKNEDHAARLKQEMDQPSFKDRPFYIAVRQAENHDRVSGQDGGDKRIASRPPYGQGLRLAKALGTIPLLSNGVPMLFMGQEYGETRPFSFDNCGESIDPQRSDMPTENTRVAAWFSGLMGLRNDPAKGLRGQSNYQIVSTGRRTVAFTCGSNQCLFAVVTWGTPDLGQDSSWLGLPGGTPFKEIFNSSWPCFQVESEEEHANGGYDAHIYQGHILNLPFIGAVVLERR
ncbi:MAG: hypothetical protein HQL77_16450 [Magnetococcales bacterium]|nr:hypothetical protein [Magnetococcales bacterium]